MDYRRTADVQSCGYVELFVLKKDDVMTSIADYPEAQLILSRHGRKRLHRETQDSPYLREDTTSGIKDASYFMLGSVFF